MSVVSIKASKILVLKKISNKKAKMEKITVKSLCAIILFILITLRKDFFLTECSKYCGIAF